MSPWKIFIFFVSVLGLLWILSAVFPEEGVSLGEEANLRFASSKELFRKDSTDSHYTDSLIRHASVTDDPEFGEVKNTFSTSPAPVTSSARDVSSPLGSSSAQDVSKPLKTTPSSNTSPAQETTSAVNRSAFPGSSPSPVKSSDQNVSRPSKTTPPSKTSPLSKTSPDPGSKEERLTGPGDKIINMDSIIRARIDSVASRVYPIEIPGQKDPGLNAFFAEAERSRDDGRLVRILHYGDSQIENDRMTSLLRYRFQKMFGGSGCGMVPAIPLYHGNPTFRQNFKGDWIRYTGFGKRDTSLQHSSYGMMACFTSVPMPKGDELPYLEYAFLPGRRASRFSEMKIYLHSYVDNGRIIVHYNDTISDTIAPVADGYQEIAQQVDIDVKKVRLEFDLRQGGRIYGISFDPDAGVQMDNIAMRGSSGLEFSRSDSVVLDTMLKAVNPELIIMQFGGNVVPYIHNYDFYRRRFTRELNYLRSLTPGTAFVVIGPGDMSMKENGMFTTYHTLEPVRDALRDAAHDTGCAFWDMYAAMGGRNSIQNFVLADPPLASTDYIHFTPRGANLMASMFFDAMMLEYGKYKAAKQLTVNSGSEK